ncbi:MAG TPA: hypothetical protein VEF55_06245 [Candidatus Binatia bacterium]|nr:hypothetical protein [Candidatus Binatia bacterium]
MSGRQEQTFLWDWTRRRRHGRLAVLMFGLAIGAAGGLLFAILMLWGMTMNGASFGLNEDEMSPFMLWLGRLLGPTGFLFAVSIPAFAGLGAFLSFRVWDMIEYRYHSLLDAGVRVPDRRPSLTFKERMPAIIVLAVFGLIVLGMLYGLWWELNRGAL